MKSKFSFIFSILISSTLIEANISVEHLNNELKKDYFFVERSLNQSDLKIDSSQGKITFDESGSSLYRTRYYLNVLASNCCNYSWLHSIHDFLLGKV